MSNQNDARASYPLGPALDFLQRLWQLNRALEKVSSHMERTMGVTAQQRLVLRCVGKYPGLTAGHLATLLHLDPGTVSASLARLETKALLERRRDPQDNRRVSLGLTSKGRALDHPATGTVEGAIERLLAVVPAAELGSMVSVVQQLTLLLGQEIEEPPPPPSPPP
jgi:DNA-binding MarR family transcriptional regulator